MSDSIIARFVVPNKNPGHVYQFGKVVGEPIDLYHKGPFISKSKLDDYRRLPLFYRRKYIDGVVPRDTSEAMSLGNVVGCLLCEGQAAYDARYVAMPSFGDLRLKENKAAKAAWEADPANQGREPITAEHNEIAMEILASVTAHPVARDLLFADGVEGEVTWRSKLSWHSGIQVRTDAYNAKGCNYTQGRPYIVDVKTVRELISTDGFTAMRRNYADYGYHRQHAMYQSLVSEITAAPISDFFFVAVETQQPFSVMVFKSSPRALAQGWSEVVAALKQMRESYEKNEWPGLPTDVQELDLSNYYYANAENYGAATDAR